MGCSCCHALCMHGTRRVGQGGEQGGSYRHDQGLYDATARRDLIPANIPTSWLVFTPSPNPRDRLSGCVPSRTAQSSGQYVNAIRMTGTPSPCVVRLRELPIQGIQDICRPKECVSDRGVRSSWTRSQYGLANPLFSRNVDDSRGPGLSPQGAYAYSECDATDGAIALISRYGNSLSGVSS